MVDLSGAAGTLALAAGGAVVAAVVLQSESVRGAVNEATGGAGYQADIQAPQPAPTPQISTPLTRGETEQKSTVDSPPAIDPQYRVTPEADVSFTDYTSDDETGAYTGP